MIEIDSVQLAKITLNYQILRSKRRKKSISIRINSQGIQVIVPQNADSADIKEIISHKSAWITKRLKHTQQLLATNPPPQNFIAGEFISYLGRQYPIIRTDTISILDLQDNNFLIPVNSDQDKLALCDRDTIRQQLTNWYIQQAKKFIPTRVELYAQHFGLATPKIFIRNQKKRWGSCNSKGELRFNWRIIIAPLDLLDYVVAHELCHLEHFDHSPAFWQRLHEIMPDCDRRRQELAQNSILFDIH